MRVIKALAALCFVALGLVFGALNRQHVSVDLGLASIDARLGFIILVALLAGAFIGGLAVMAGVVWPMRRRSRAEGPRPAGARNSGPVTAEFPAFREPPR
jgi:uncharacterized integral membrane protein